jgi:hypothetical protein
MTLAISKSLSSKPLSAPEGDRNVDFGGDIGGVEATTRSLEGEN